VVREWPLWRVDGFTIRWKVGKFALSRHNRPHNTAAAAVITAAPTPAAAAPTPPATAAAAVKQ